MRPDVKLDGVSVSSLGWLRESIDFPAPQSQTNTIIVPGRNSPIRFTEALGRVSYQPRSFTVTLSMLGSRAAFEEKCAILANTYAGRLTQVKTGEEPQYYMVGTIELAPSYDPLNGKGQMVISCSDADAYRYHTEETVVTVTGSGTAMLNCDYMPVVPVITTTEETSLSWSVGGEAFQKTLSAGTWTIAELELAHGSNTVTVTGSGTTTFTYREGRL